MMMLFWFIVIFIASGTLDVITAYTNLIPTQTDVVNRRRTPLPSQQQIPHSKFAFTIYSTTEDSSNNNGAGGGGLVRQTDSNMMNKQLLNAFTNLGAADQYDAVLTGLCAKILDSDTSTTGTSSTATNQNSNNMSPDRTIVAIQDCIALLEEMNTSKITASSRSLMALIDVNFVSFSFQL